MEEIGNAASNRILSGKVSQRSIRLVNHGTYSSSPSHIVNYNVILVDTKVTPIWNTMAAIPGHIKNEVVVIGNHRDG